MPKKDELIFAREEHFCPYIKNCTCSGWTCGTDCNLHPDYEDDDYISDYISDCGKRTPTEFEQGYRLGLQTCKTCHFNEKNRVGFDIDGFTEEESKAYVLGYKDAVLKEDPLVYDEYLSEIIESFDFLRSPYKEDNKFYIIGYKDGFSHIKPKVEDEQIEELFEEAIDDLTYDDGYIQGYKECLLELKPSITNDDLNYLIEEAEAQRESEKEEKEIY